jgi:molybdate transport system ATP-binding protein
MLTIRALSVRLNDHVLLENVSFELNRGENIAIIGASGSGKSLLAKAIAGKIYFHGTISYDFEGTPTIGYVEQYHRFKNKSNTSDLYYQQRYNAIDAEDAIKVAELMAPVNSDILQIMRQLNVSHILDQPLLQLSNGEHKKLQLTQMLAKKPDLIILDDPFVGLDRASRLDLHHVIDQLILEGKCIILFTSYQEIPHSISHIGILEHGKLLSVIPRQSAELQPIGSLMQAHVPVFLKESFPKARNSSPFKIAISMNAVSISYGNKKILSHINWKVERGEKWLVLGPNGSGKSTLLSLVTGDHPQAYANDIILFDQRRGTGESIWDIKKRIGYLSPELHMYFDKGVTVADAIGSGWFDTIGLFKKLSSEQSDEINSWLTRAGMQALKEKFLAQLSFGEQRIILLLRAFIKHPELIILDEPLQGLNEEQQVFLLGMIDLLCASPDRTLVYVSHYPEIRPRCIQSFIRLDRGEIIEQNRIEQLDGYQGTN